MFGGVTERLKFELTADADQAVGAFRHLDEATRTHVIAAEQRLDRLGTNFTRVGLGMIGASTAAGVGLVKLAGNASDLDEAANAVRVSFKDAADGVLELSENSARSVGLSKAEFLTAAVSFRSFAESIGNDSGEVVEVVDQLTSRAADMASVYNMDVADAMDKMRSGLAGQTEPWRNLGIDISAATVEAYALANGIGDADRQLTESEKVVARYGLIMQETERYAGDFVNTADSMANQQRVMSAEMADAAAGIGAGVVPMIEAFQGGLLKVTGAIADLSPETQAMIGRFAALGTAGVGVLGTLSLVTGQAIKMRNRFSVLGEDGTRSFNKVGKAAAGIGVAMGVAAAALVIYSVRAQNTANRNAALTDGFAELARVADEDLAQAFSGLMALGEFDRSLEENLANFAAANLEAAKRVLELDQAMVGSRDVSVELAEAIANEERARAQAAETAELYGEQLDDTTPIADELAEAIAGLGDAVEDTTDELEQHREALAAAADAARDNRDAIEEMVTAHRRAADSTFAVADQTDKYEQLLEDLDEQLQAVADDQRATNRIYRDGTREAASLADAHVRLADDTAAANGQTLTAADRLDVWNRAMIDAAGQAEGPLRDAILEYIGAVNDIPEDVLTDIGVHLDAGDVAAAEAAIDEASRNRDSLITAHADADAADRALDRAARARTAHITTRVGGIGSDRFMATGGIAGPVSIAGENFRPELIDGRLITGPTVVPPGSHVTGEGRTEQLLERAARPAPTTNVTVNMPAGTDPTAVLTAIRRYERRNGPT